MKNILSSIILYYIILCGAMGRKKNAYVLCLLFSSLAPQEYIAKRAWATEHPSIQKIFYSTFGIWLENTTDKRDTLQKNFTGLN